MLNLSIDIWKMFAGVAFFLLAMNFMEDSLRLLAGRRFKLFLKNNTTNKTKGIAGGAIVTGLLQSSSIVNLLVLSMVGAGVVKMENALALMLGSNLGTTLNSWILVTLGFNYNIESIILPVAGITGIGMAFSGNQSKGYLWLKFVFSLAFLFIALSYIKTGMESYVQQTDLSFFNRFPLLVFVLLGVLLTAVVQSSSATIALTLSALNANAITLLVATAIVLGSEIGTTLKLFLASAKGIAVKKRVALGNFLFNLITVTAMFFLLRPVNFLITEIIQLEDHLIALVFFQSFVNLFCIILFYPFLTLFGKFLMKRYQDNDDAGLFISKEEVNEPELALMALEKATNRFIINVIDYSLDSFHLADEINNKSALYKNYSGKTLIEKYDRLKHVHGEIHGFSLRLQNSTLEFSTAERLNQLIAANRNIMYAAKNIRDAETDIEQMRNSSNDIKYNFYKQSKEKLAHFYRQIQQILNSKAEMTHFTSLTTLHHTITKGYAETLQLLYKESLAKNVSETEISTLINFNRELYTSFKSLLFGLKDYLLTTKEADYFDTLPGFIR